MRRLLCRCQDLTDTKVRVSNHTYVFITPILLCTPFDQIIGVQVFLRIVCTIPFSLALAHSTGIGNNVGISSAYKIIDVTGFQGMVKNQRLGRNRAAL